jgi:HEAT repeat protein
MGRLVTWFPLLLALLLLPLPGDAAAQKAKKRKGKKEGPAATLTVDVAATRAELFGADADRAAAAAAKLGQSRQPGVLDALLDALAMGLHPRVASAVLDAVAAHQAQSALEALLHYARHRDAEVRGKSIAALGSLDDKKAMAAWKHALRDGDRGVRAIAARIAAARRETGVTQELIALMKKGDEAAPSALATVASPEVAIKVAELIGEAPDRLVAECLGALLLRADLGKEDIYVEIVRALGKIPGEEAVVALTGFISATPEKPVRQSRREAQTIYEQKLGGGGN